MIYASKTHRIVIRFVAKYTNHYDHTYVPEEDSVVWSLDYEKSSDFDDVAGHWHLEDIPRKPVCWTI